MEPETAFLLIAGMCFIMFISTAIVMEAKENKQQRRKDKEWKKRL